MKLSTFNVANLWESLALKKTIPVFISFAEPEFTVIVALLRLFFLFLNQKRNTCLGL